MLANDNKFFLVRTLVNPIVECAILADTKNSTGGSKVTAEAIFQKCDEPNANGHTFPRKVLASALKDIEPEIKNRHFLGELDHPEDINDINRIGTVALKNASHVITQLAMDGNYVVGRFETLDTPAGNILASILKDKIKIGVSVRAITDQDISYGMDNVNEITDFHLISYDAVHNPAYSDAYVKTLVASVFKLETGGYNVKPLDTKLENTADNTLITITADEFKEYTKQLTKTILENMYRNKVN